MRKLLLFVVFSLPLPAKAESGYGGWIQEDAPWSDDGRTGGAGIRWASCAGTPWEGRYELLTNRYLGARADMVSVATRVFGEKRSGLWIGATGSGSFGGGQAQDRIHGALSSGSPIQTAVKDGISPRLAPVLSLRHEGPGRVGLVYELDAAPGVYGSAKVGLGIALGPLHGSAGYWWGDWHAPGVKDVLGPGWWGRVRAQKGRAATSVEWYPTSGRGIKKTLAVWRIEWMLKGAA